jgi:CDP-diacylglycerol--serine O-phosphatidyltransferase
VCVALRLARFNVSSNEEPSWEDNFFEGVPAPAGGIIVLMPLIFNFSELAKVNLNFDYNLIVPTIFVIISFLLISTVPTYSFKKIVIPRKMTVFLLFSIVLFFGLLLIYTFKVIAISGIIYLSLIPVSYFHYKNIKNKQNIDIAKKENEDFEDIL